MSELDRSAVDENIPAAHTGNLATLAGYIDAVPPALSALDHVQATPETVLRRALWLHAEYDLTASDLVVLGDHDLTSLAILLVCPRARVTVVDVDDRVLEYIDSCGAGVVTTLHADLRVGLPPAVRGTAEVVFSDPPYSPAGMALFAARGIACLAEPTRGRLLLAYGYSRRHPTLGAKVQRELAGLGLVFEAILPGFHTYTGAPSLGSAADLYVCRPTIAAPAVRATSGIYTRGPSATESTPTPQRLVDPLREIASGEHALPVAHHDGNWAKPITAGNSGTALAIDLDGDPGPWLVRVLLACNAERVAMLLPNDHPDLADERAQAALHGLLRDKYHLRLLRSTPDNTHAVVLAEAVPAEEANPVAHAVLRRAHGKVANTWREAMVAASGGELTKNTARDRIRAHDLAIGDHRLIDLPRHHLAELVPLLRTHA